MSFDFNKNAKKNFKFLKSINDTTEIELSKIKTNDGNYLVPLCHGNKDDEKVFKKYFGDECSIYFHFHKKNSHSYGVLSLRLDEKNKKFIVDEFDLILNISMDEFM
ncbi:hypothetical protein OBA39_02930, partial [Acidimicrobiaceae bacterium]|nr:hypothetical protein [Acidimicrobiaceae bacterium]